MAFIIFILLAFLTFRAHFHFFTQLNLPPESNMHIIYFFAAVFLRFPIARASDSNHGGKLFYQLGPCNGPGFSAGAGSGKTLDKRDQADRTTANAISEQSSSKCKFPKFDMQLELDQVKSMDCQYSCCLN